MDFTKIDIKPYQVGPLLATPKTLALLFAGASAYISFVDPNARNSLEQTRQRLKHWAVMFNESKTTFELLAAAAALSSVACYMKTKQNMWLVGGAMMALLFPYTALVLGSSTNYLLDNDKKLDPKIEMTSSEKFTVL
jgi:hypothetical protein